VDAAREPGERMDEVRGSPLLVLSIWSRDWIGWWSLIPIALSVVWLCVNPLFFTEPRSTNNWASKGVFRERIWTEGDRSAFPTEFRSRVPAVTMIFQAAGLAVLIYGLVVLDPLASVTGIVIMQLAKLWYIDRMVPAVRCHKVEERRVRRVGLRER
jgi:hypothetical protein